jgi:hypothetical protein
MMDNDFTRWLIQLGIGGVLAGGIFWVYRKDMIRWLELWKGQSEKWNRQSELLMTVVRDNTEAITALRMEIRGKRSNGKRWTDETGTHDSH